MTSVTDINANRYNAVTWPNDQYSQIVLAATLLDTGSAIVRGDTSGAGEDRDVYFGGLANIFEGNNDSRIFKYVDGTYTSIASNVTDIAAGDTLYLEVQGTSLLLKVNGSNRVGPSTDTAHASGGAGIGAYYSTVNVALMDTWEGGDFVAAGGAVPYQPWMQRAPVLAQ